MPPAPACRNRLTPRSPQGKHRLGSEQVRGNGGTGRPMPADLASRWGHARPTQRLMGLARDFRAQPMAPIPRAFRGAIDVQAPYRFMDHQDVEFGTILQPHYAVTEARICGLGEGAVVLDTKQARRTPQAVPAATWQRRTHTGGESSACCHQPCAATGVWRGTSIPCGPAVASTRGQWRGRLFRIACAVLPSLHRSRYGAPCQMKIVLPLDRYHPADAQSPKGENSESAEVCPFGASLPAASHQLRGADQRPTEDRSRPRLQPSKSA